VLLLLLLLLSSSSSSSSSLLLLFTFKSIRNSTEHRTSLNELNVPTKQLQGL
jgi:hypothetical protein